MPCPALLAWSMIAWALAVALSPVTWFLSIWSIVCEMLGNTCSSVVPCGVLWSAGSCCVTRWARSAIATCSLLLRLDACLCSHQTQPTQPTASRTTHPSTIQVVARRRIGFFLVTS